MEILAGLEANGFAGRNGDLCAGARVAPDAGFPGLDGEDAESAQFNAIAFNQALFHGVEDGIDGGFGFDSYQPGALNDALNEILFDQRCLT